MSDFLLMAGIFAAAILYSSIGHGGASGYLAVMALFNEAPEAMRPVALILNILVASIGAIRFYRAGAFRWSIFWPFAIASVPCAFLGGASALPATTYKQLVGLVLLFAAFRLFRKPASQPWRTLTLPGALAAGAGIGLLSGLTGVGGGIFLSPLILMMGWADPKTTCGVSAAFIVVNSIAGFLGLMTSGVHLPADLALWTLAALAGGLVGSEFGSRRLAGTTLRRLLSAVLVIAGLKMMLI